MGILDKIKQRQNKSKEEFRMEESGKLKKEVAKPRVYESKEEYQRVAKERRKISQVEAKARKRIERTAKKEREKQKEKLVSGMRQIRKVAEGTGIVKRPYTKTSRWYSTRTTKKGGYRSPSQFRGVRTSRPSRAVGRPPAGVGGSIGGNKFNVGGVGGVQRDITAVGVHEGMDLSFGSPLEDRGDRSEFEGASELLRVTDSRQSDLLKVGSKDDGKKRDIEWF